MIHKVRLIQSFLDFFLQFVIYLEFAEKLFHKLEKCKERFEVKLMHLNLISRLIGIHKVSQQHSRNGVYVKRTFTLSALPIQLLSSPSEIFESSPTRLVQHIRTDLLIKSLCFFRGHQASDVSRPIVSRSRPP